VNKTIIASSIYWNVLTCELQYIEKSIEHLEMTVVLPVLHISKEIPKQQQQQQQQQLKQSLNMNESELNSDESDKESNSEYYNKHFAQFDSDLNSLIIHNPQQNEKNYNRSHEQSVKFVAEIKSPEFEKSISNTFNNQKEPSSIHKTFVLTLENILNELRSIILTLPNMIDSSQKELEQTMTFEKFSSLFLPKEMLSNSDSNLLTNEDNTLTFHKPSLFVVDTIYFKSNNNNDSNNNDNNNNNNNTKLQTTENQIKNNKYNPFWITEALLYGILQQARQIRRKLNFLVTLCSNCSDYMQSSSAQLLSFLYQQTSVFEN
jgi:hypothetical protein